MDTIEYTFKMTPAAALIEYDKLVEIHHPYTEEEQNCAFKKALKTILRDEFKYTLMFLYAKANICPQISEES